MASSAPTSTVVSQAPSGSSSGSGVTSFLSQRAQLERERLERQRKLQGNANTKSQDPDEGDTDDEDERPAKRRHLATSSFAGTQEASNSKQSRPEDQNFWKGELRQTATRFAEPRADGQSTFRLTQVLGQVPQSFGTPIDSSFTFASPSRNLSWLSLLSPLTPWTYHGSTNSSTPRYPSSLLLNLMRTDMRA